MRQSATTAWALRAAGLLFAAAGVLSLMHSASPEPPVKPDTATPQQQKPPPLPKVRYGTQGLPRPVLDLRDALLAAIESGRIEELGHIYDMSGMKPDLGVPGKTDPVAHWKANSGDGQGRETLAALSLILDSGYVAIPRGADIENNQLYVWPYFAEVPLGKLTPRQEVELLRLVPANVASEMKEKGKYTHWRLAIGADGTWHALRKGE
ncbi:MAG: hypothetical protein J2P50_04385 [Hyphomicrobiaceae bacterium]|nr:hypothetical protein [Hyphomicrobiaceae bacterium]